MEVAEFHNPLPVSGPFAGEKEGDTLLLYLPVPLFGTPGNYTLDDQACEGLRLWADNFSRIIAMLPVEEGEKPVNWAPISTIGPALARIEFVPLPVAYRPDRFFRHLAPVRHEIAAQIRRAQFLSFAIGGLFGDWGAVACFEAHRMGRPFAVWTDRVESEVVREGAASGSLRSRIRARLTHRPMAMLERAVIRRATVGLFHGRETYNAYAPYSPSPEIVHDIHMTADDHITPAALADKCAAVLAGPLRIAYLGRADAMKGPFDWLDVLAGLKAAGVTFEATWLGDGELRPAMLERVERMGLGGAVSLPGFSRDRTANYAALRAAHVFLFCHKTPESPRCLIEALASGTPIVGYDGAFAADLISGHDGGVLVPRNDVAALTAATRLLANDRVRLADLIERAARDGAPFTDAAVFHHRSALIRQYLTR